MPAFLAYLIPKDVDALDLLLSSRSFSLATYIYIPVQPLACEPLYKSD